MCPGHPQQDAAHPVALVGQLLPCARRDRTVLPMWVQTSPQILHSPTAGS